MIRIHCIGHHANCHPGKRDCNPEASIVVREVQEAHGEGAKEDAEVHPGEESAFIGEEDFGLDSNGEGDLFVGRRGEEGGGRHFSRVKLWRSSGNGIKMLDTTIEL